MIPSSHQGSQRIEGVIVLASSLHLSPHQRTPSPPPLSSSCSSRRSAKLKTSNPSYHRNQQYSIIGLTNAAGTLVERYSYTAYGTLGIYDASGTVRTSSTYANRYTYTGREYNPDLNLYHFRARWYDPTTGGFISRDPLGYVDGMSLYRGYFGVRGVDPLGLRNGSCRMEVACKLIENNRFDGGKRDCFYECTEITGTSTSGAGGFGDVGNGEPFGCGDVQPRPYKHYMSKRQTGFDIGILAYCRDCKNEFETSITILKETIFPDCSPTECRKACDEGVEAVEKFCKGKPALKELCKALIEGFNVLTCHAICDGICKSPDKPNDQK